MDAAIKGETPVIARPTYREAFNFWLKLGFISFGGPAGQIAIMHEFLVDKKRWISDSRFMHALNYCMILPGPEAQQLATYIGWLMHGTIGGLTAGILFILPSVFILLGLSITYVTFGKLAWVAAIFYGLKPAVVAIVLLALIKIGKKSLVSIFHYFVALLSFVCIFFFDIPFPVIILGAIPIGILGQKFYPSFFKPGKDSAKADANEHTYYLNKFSPPLTVGADVKSVTVKIITAVMLWAVPFVVLVAFSQSSAFWTNLISFFTKAALVTFGGAYAVLPYVAQVSVEKFHWLNEFQMIDGLALGETTPGPLIMVLVFVGFMAGYNVTSGSLLAGTLGLLATTYYTFLPSLTFIFIGAPFVEKTKENARLRQILGIVTAAVVGVVLNLTIYFGKAVLFAGTPGQLADWFALIWLALSFVAMYHYKVNMIVWILISAVAGFLYMNVSAMF
jgi:chromate transporter